MAVIRCWWEASVGVGAHHVVRAGHVRRVGCHQWSGLHVVVGMCRSKAGGSAANHFLLINKLINA